MSETDKGDNATITREREKLSPVSQPKYMNVLTGLSVTDKPVESVKYDGKKTEPINTRMERAKLGGVSTYPATHIKTGKTSDEEVMLLSETDKSIETTPPEPINTPYFSNIFHYHH